jgi:hypothetical protein
LHREVPDLEERGLVAFDKAQSAVSLFSLFAAAGGFEDVLDGFVEVMHGCKSAMQASFSEPLMRHWCVIARFSRPDGKALYRLYELSQRRGGDQRDNRNSIRIERSGEDKIEQVYERISPRVSCSMCA